MKECNAGCCRSCESSGFYTGVMDIEVRSGTIGEMDLIGEYRVFNDKFVDSPELALIVAFDEDNKRWDIPAHKIMENVTYDSEKMEWKRTFFETTKGHAPTEKQWKKFEKGEYILHMITEYVQIMETNLIGSEDMVDRACKLWEERILSTRKK